MVAHAKQKASDAAFFEDWSEWQSLDDLPLSDKQFGHFVQQPHRHNRYWCFLRHHSDLVGGAAFELSLPENDRICRMIETIPGVRRLPGRFHRQPGYHLVPAENWQQLRNALPALKAAILDHIRIKG